MLKTTLAALAAMTLTAATAAAQDFTLIIYEPPSALAARTDPARAEAYWSRFNAFAGQLAQAGVLRGGSALSETESHTIDRRGGRAGARTQRRTQTGGYLVIDVADMQEATRWAAQTPGLDEGTVVEVRPHRPNPMMAMR
ncbi:MAG: YciI family protein [Hyphomonadaceae bacterium]|nr:YciI family protein [Hyphomonadaceae bacterium]